MPIVHLSETVTLLLLSANTYKVLFSVRRYVVEIFLPILLGIYMTWDFKHTPSRDYSSVTFLLISVRVLKL